MRHSLEGRRSIKHLNDSLYAMASSGNVALGLPMPAPITPSLLIFVAFQPRRAIELLRNAERLAILPSVAIQLPTPILVGGSALIIVGGQVRVATATLERRIKVTRLLLRRAAAQVGSAEVGFARSASHGNVLFPGRLTR